MELRVGNEYYSSSYSQDLSGNLNPQRAWRKEGRLHGQRDLECHPRAAVPQLHDSAVVITSAVCPVFLVSWFWGARWAHVTSSAELRPFREPLFPFAMMTTKNVPEGVTPPTWMPEQRLGSLGSRLWVGDQHTWSLPGSALRIFSQGEGKEEGWWMEQLGFTESSEAKLALQSCPKLGQWSDPHVNHSLDVSFPLGRGCDLR